ncbi:hypothetical protein OFO01_00995 [Campylobacter sp. JMF_01 NE2]|uniref:SPL family radical SAM protein n=1 Tax=unclassified Campylobacter TaxID=2593542 RepID=UPI0022EA04B3|nr:MULTISPECIES: hypothetical protein [unclassified Campylobacter]MDA3052032.1 hypothetical protein [Campylobacter sp. JMF_03 NE3]MDA3066366.1 hypothetical protein [Campylobacter sp. JMF_01 NE2]
MSEINSEFKLALNAENSELLREFFLSGHFSFQERKQIAEICADLQAWGENVGEILKIAKFGENRGVNFASNFSGNPNANFSGNSNANFSENPSVNSEPNLQSKPASNHACKQVFARIKSAYELIKSRPPAYENFTPHYTPKRYEISRFAGEKLALGRCPVASEGTRCCNLLTLDAVNSCGFDCSYCAIGSFYKNGVVGFDENFGANLAKLHLDSDKIYHIGTGQSSDSLMWGDNFGILSALNSFARAHENVILELKSKSNNISFFLQNDISRNIIVTFSLNPQIIIENEEHLSASLDERLNAAKKLAQKGILVGFHFHPMIYFQGWRDEYSAIFARLVREFDPSSVALVSFGTLTFIKPVIKKLRARGLESKILQMPFSQANGKISYPKNIKLEMFKFAYSSLRAWHEEVFFYLCMEDEALWGEVFGREFASNDEFERAMKEAYMRKIKENR